MGYDKAEVGCGETRRGWNPLKALQAPISVTTGVQAAMWCYNKLKQSVRLIRIFIK